MNDLKIILELSVAYPKDNINISSILRSLPKNSFEVLIYQPDMFMTIFDKKTNITFQIHKNGRFAIKTKIASESTDKKLINQLYKRIKWFIIKFDEKTFENLKNETNIILLGDKAQSYFWANYKEFDNFGAKYFENCLLRTYTTNPNALYLKLSSK